MRFKTKDGTVDIVTLDAANSGSTSIAGFYVSVSIAFGDSCTTLQSKLQDSSGTPGHIEIALSLDAPNLTLTLRNASASVAFRDPLYITTYRDGRGIVVDERHEFIKDIFEPGDVRQVEANDGYARARFASAALRIAAAEALLPVPATISDAERRPR